MAFSATTGLSTNRIDETITFSAPGVYLLDRTTTGPFNVNYVGRSDDDVAGRLKKHAAKGTYKFFQFEYAMNAKAAFERECQLYHNFDNLDNDVHPARPAGTNYPCPVKGCKALW